MLMLRVELEAFKSQPSLMHNVELSIYDLKSSRKKSFEDHSLWTVILDINSNIQDPFIERTVSLVGSVARQKG